MQEGLSLPHLHQISKALLTSGNYKYNLICPPRVSQMGTKQNLIVRTGGALWLQVWEAGWMPTGRIGCRAVDRDGGLVMDGACSMEAFWMLSLLSFSSIIFLGFTYRSQLPPIWGLCWDWCWQPVGEWLKRFIHVFYKM